MSHSFLVGDVPIEPIEGPNIATPNEGSDYSIPPHPGSTYNWTVTGGTIVNEQDNEVTVIWDQIAVGEICVSVTTAMGCTSRVECLSVELIPSNTNTITSLSQWSVFPNPAADHLWIDMTWDQKEEVSIQLFNTVGTSLHSFPRTTFLAGTSQFFIPLDDLPKGIYLLVLQRQNQTAVQRLIIQ